MYDNSIPMRLIFNSQSLNAEFYSTIFQLDCIRDTGKTLLVKHTKQCDIYAKFYKQKVNHTDILVSHSYAYNFLFVLFILSLTDTTCSQSRLLSET